MPFDGTLATALGTEQRSLATALGRHELVRARLRFARNQIAAGRWCQRYEHDDDGNRCLIGWAQGAELPQIGMCAIVHLWRALPKSAQHCSAPMRTDLARYNDTHTRNAVIKLLDRAIETT